MNATQTSNNCEVLVIKLNKQFWWFQYVSIFEGYIRMWPNSKYGIPSEIKPPLNFNCSWNFTISWNYQSGVLSICAGTNKARQRQILIPNIKYQRINGENWTDFIIANLTKEGGWSEHVSKIFLGQITKNNEKLQRNPSVRRGFFRPYGFWKMGFLKNTFRGVMRWKTEWALLGSFKLIAI